MLSALAMVALGDKQPRAADWVLHKPAADTAELPDGGQRNSQQAREEGGSTRARMR